MFARARRAVQGLAHVRGYAEDTLNLHALATRLESGPTKPQPSPVPTASANNSARTLPLGYEHSLIAKQGKSMFHIKTYNYLGFNVAFLSLVDPAPRLPEGFIPFDANSVSFVPRIQKGYSKCSQRLTLHTVSCPLRVSHRPTGNTNRLKAHQNHLH
jgi:hypothetical protein